MLSHQPREATHNRQKVGYDIRGVAGSSASAAQSRLDVMEATSLTPLVGREAELTLLMERWAQSQDGLGQVVLLSGEAGIGKPQPGNYPYRSQIITGTHHYRYRSPSPTVWPNPHACRRDTPQ